MGNDYDQTIRATGTHIPESMPDTRRTLPAAHELCPARNMPQHEGKRSIARGARSNP